VGYFEGVVSEGQTISAFLSGTEVLKHSPIAQSDDALFNSLDTGRKRKQCVDAKQRMLD